MSPNRTSVWKILTIWISRQLSFFNFERPVMLCTWIGHPSEKLLPFEFLERFSCSISSVSLCSALESDIRAKSYRHLNFSRVSGIHFRASRCDAPESDFRCEKLWLFEFIESFRCSIWSVSICDAPESDLRVISYDHLNFSRPSIVQFWASRYIMSSNRTSVWKVMTIWISRKLSLFNFKRPVMLCTWIGHPSEKLLPFEFLERFSCSIWSVSIYDAPESDLRVISYVHLNFLRAFVVQFWASRYIMSPNRTSVWKVMTIWISQQLSLFNFEFLVMLCTWIGHPSEKLLPFEFPGDLVVLFRASRYIIRLNLTYVWKFMTIWISREFPMFNFERLHMLCSWIGHPSEKLLPFEILESLRCSISRVSIYDVA